MGVKTVVREIFLPWFNSYRYLIQNISRYEATTGTNFIFDPQMMSKIENANIMDKWILSATQSLIKYVRAEMESYKLYMVVRPLLSFLEKLSNWYVRLNKKRMKGDEGNLEQQRSLNVLFEVLHNTNVLMASITPFITEHMYQNMRNGISEADEHLKAPSIHFLQIPEVDESRIDKHIEEKIARMQSAIENGRLIRDRNNISLKTPLSKVILVDADQQNLQDYMDVKQYILEELNCLDIAFEHDEDEYVNYKCDPDNKEIGSVLKKKYDKAFKTEISNLSSGRLREYLKNGFIMMGDIKIENGWLKVEKIF